MGPFQTNQIKIEGNLPTRSRAAISIQLSVPQVIMSRALTALKKQGLSISTVKSNTEASNYFAREDVSNQSSSLEQKVPVTVKTKNKKQSTRRRKK